MLKTTLTLALLLMLMLLSACSEDKPLTKRQRLMQSIDQIEAAFEERVLGDVMQYISQDYQDERGRGHDDLKKAVQIQLIRNQSIHIFSVVKDIQWQEDQQATVELAAAMGGQPIESVNILTSIRADMAKFDVVFVLEEGLYKVKSAVWRWAEPSDFL